MADYYEILGDHPRTRPTTRSNAPTARWPVSTTPTATPTFPTPRRSSRRSTSPTRRCRDPERRRRYDVFGDEDGAARPGRPPGGAGDAFGFGDIFDAFFGGDPFGNGAARRARRVRPTPRRSCTSTSPQAAFGTTATVDVRLPGRVRPLRGFGLRARHAPGALRRVRRRGRGARGPALDPRSDRHRGAVRRVQRDGQPHPHPVPRVSGRRPGPGVALDRRRGPRGGRRRSAPAPLRVAGPPRRAAVFPATST